MIVSGGERPCPQDGENIMLTEREMMERHDVGEIANVEYRAQVAKREAAIAARQLKRFLARCTVSMDAKGNVRYTYNPVPDAPDFGVEKILYPYTTTSTYRETKVFDKASPIFYGLPPCRKASDTDSILSELSAYPAHLSAPLFEACFGCAEIPFAAAVELEKAEHANRRKRGNSVLYYAVLAWNSAGMRRNGKGKKMQYAMVESIDVQATTYAERGLKVSVDGKAGRTIHTTHEMFDSLLEYNTRKEEMKAARSRALAAKKDRANAVKAELQRLASTPDGAARMLESIRENPTIRKRLSRMGISARKLATVAGK